MVDIPFYAELLARVLGGVLDQDELEHEELRLEGARDALGLVLGPAGRAQVSDEDSMVDIPFYAELLARVLGGVLVQDELEHVNFHSKGLETPSVSYLDLQDESKCRTRTVW